MNGTLISADNSWALFAVLACVAAAAIYLEQHYRWAAKMTGCVLALLGSMLLTNLHIIPTEAKTYDFIWDYIVPLSIPMLLFEADIRKIGKRSGRLMIVFLIGGLGTIVGGLLAYQLLRSAIPGLAKAVPMMIGTYTGGTINLVAMADNYHASSELVSAAVVADDLVMVVYLFILMAVPEGTFYLSRRKDTKKKKTGATENPSIRSNACEQRNYRSCFFMRAKRSRSGIIRFRLLLAPEEDLSAERRCNFRAVCLHRCGLIDSSRLSVCCHPEVGLSSHAAERPSWK